MQELVSALVNQYDIGRECIFRDVESAEMTFLLCPKLTDSMLMPLATYGFELQVYGHSGCI